MCLRFSKSEMALWFDFGRLGVQEKLPADYLDPGKIVINTGPFGQFLNLDNNEYSGEVHTTLALNRDPRIEMSFHKLPRNNSDLDSNFVKWTINLLTTEVYPIQQMGSYFAFNIKNVNFCPMDLPPNWPSVYSRDCRRFVAELKILNVTIFLTLKFWVHHEPHHAQDVHCLYKITILKNDDSKDCVEPPNKKRRM